MKIVSHDWLIEVHHSLLKNGRMVSSLGDLFHHVTPTGMSYLYNGTWLHDTYTGELGYDGPLYDGFLHMTDDMLGPSPMHIKYSSYVYDGFCI